MSIRAKTVLPSGQAMTEIVLANGLRAFVIQNPQAPVFTYQTWFNVGSRDEKLDPALRRTGLAHLFEHMMFRGTKTHGDGEFDRLLSEGGSYDQNATTWNDRTNYYVSLPAEQLELVMRLEADRMENLVVDHDLLETEKGAVLGEFRMGLDDPDNLAGEKLYLEAFTAHPYRFPTIGTEEEIKGFTVEDARHFYKTYYSPNNATILIAGAVDPQTVDRLLENHYGSFASQTIPRLSASVEPEQRGERRHEFEHPQLSQPKVLLGFHAPSVRDATHPALTLLNGMLTFGRGALLQEAWVNSGIAVSIGGGVDSFQEPGLFSFGADLQPGMEPERLLRAFDKTLARLSLPLIEAGLERARNQILLRTYGAWEDNSSLASYLGEYLVSAGSLEAGFEYLNQLERVHAKDVKEVAERYLTPQNRTVIVGREEGKSA